MNQTCIDITTQYLTFKLDSELFAIDVAKVREILDFTPATKVPGTPAFMPGIINVRGNVIPVVDMRLKFGMSRTEKTVDTCIVVLEISVDNETTIVGALVDSVEEVFELEPKQIVPPPSIGTRWRSEFLRGIGKHSDNLIIILDIDRIFTSDEMAVFQTANPVAALSAADGSSLCNVPPNM